jgi:hypothetical protein
MRVAAAPRPPGPPDSWSALNTLSCLPAVLVGALIIWRGRRRASAMLLGAGLLTYGLVNYDPQMLLGRTWAYLPLDIIGALMLGSISVFFAAFAMCFYEETIGPLGRPAWRWLSAYAGLCLASTALLWWGRLFLDRLPLVGDGQLLFVFVSTPGFVAALAILLAGWRNSALELQKRFLLMAVASGAVIIAQVIPVVLSFGLQMGSEMFTHPAMFVAYVASGIVAPAFFAYAIVRHRVFDLGFVLNRTLVYGAVSLILLVGFGLLEWVADHLVRIQGRETNAALDAALALGVFLTFHRVRDGVEHAVERLFFRSWQENEAALNRFVKTAGFITRPEALVQAFAGELARFTGGAGAAVYLKAEDGDYRLAAGAEGLAPTVVDADEPAVVVLRAERAPLEPEEAGSDMTAALALPMMNRAEVIGFALVGPKPAGLSYRPDETAALAHAAHQVGLDLYSLKVDQLEQRLMRLESAKPRRRSQRTDSVHVLQRR